MVKCLTGSWKPVSQWWPWSSLSWLSLSSWLCLGYSLAEFPVLSNHISPLHIHSQDHCRSGWGERLPLRALIINSDQ